jgi:hypothetical protein
MTLVTEMTDTALLVELAAKGDWLRDRSPGVFTRSTERRMKEIERELESRGVNAEAPTASRRGRLSLSRYYVAGAGQCLHADRDCLLMRGREERATMDDLGIREANEHEIESLRPCASCCE